MRQKVIGKNLSNRDFSNKTIKGYFRDCDFSNCDFSGSTIEAVAVNCKFDGSDFSSADIYRLHSPGSTFADCKFRQNFAHTAYHKILSIFNVTHNHQIIYELIRRWVMKNYPNDSIYRRRGLKAIKVIRDRPDLSWSELTKMIPDTYIDKGYRIFRNVPTLYEKLKRHRPELEPEEFKNAV